MSKYFLPLMAISLLLVAGCETTQVSETPADMQAQKSPNEVKRLTKVLLKAAEAGDLEKVKESLVPEVDVNARGADSYTALHWASWNGHNAVFNFLISKGADLNVKTKAGETVLQLAAYNGHNDIVKFLISKGMDVNATDIHNIPPIYNVAYFGHPEVITTLVKNGAKLEFVDRLSGMTPLHRAAMAGRDAAVKALIASGANIEARDKEGNTPLLLAIRYKRRGVYDALMAAGADYHAQNNLGNAALHQVAIAGHIEAAPENNRICEDLLKRGADFNMRNSQGKTPLNLAVEHKRYWTDYILRKYGATGPGFQDQ
jgi:ankyrin repeat protein